MVYKVEYPTPPPQGGGEVSSWFEKKIKWGRRKGVGKKGRRRGRRQGREKGSEGKKEKRQKGRERGRREKGRVKGGDSTIYVHP